MIKTMLTGCGLMLVTTLLILWQAECSSYANVHHQHARMAEAEGRTTRKSASHHRWIRSGYGSGGNSCMCPPYQPCDDDNDDILYLALGALLGYLLATPMMMMTTTTTMGGNAGGRAASVALLDHRSIVSTRRNLSFYKTDGVREMTAAALSSMDAFKKTVEKPRCSKILICRANEARKFQGDLKTTFDLIGCIIGLTFTTDAYSLTDHLLPIVFHRPQKTCSDITLPLNASCNSM